MYIQQCSFCLYIVSKHIPRHVQATEKKATEKKATERRETTGWIQGCSKLLVRHECLGSLSEATAAIASTLFQRSVIGPLQPRFEVHSLPIIEGN